MTASAARDPRLRALLRAAGVAAVAVVVATVHLPRPPTLDLLRALTGLPCPFCGGTTAVVALGQGRVLAGLHASPLAVALALAVVAWPLGLGRLWRALPPGARAALVTAVLGASELWQLSRFGWIG